MAQGPVVAAGARDAARQRTQILHGARHCRLVRRARALCHRPNLSRPRPGHCPLAEIRLGRVSPVRFSICPAGRPPARRPSVRPWVDTDAGTVGCTPAGANLPSTKWTLCAGMSSRRARSFLSLRMYAKTHQCSRQIVLVACTRGSATTGRPSARPSTAPRTVYATTCAPSRRKARSSGEGCFIPWLW